MTIKTNMSKVRKMCIENGWYTRGTNADYDNLLLNMCDWDIDQTEASIIEIARDIFNHSTGFDMRYSINEQLSNISFYILNDCCTFFI